jgi:hypothetical protein
MMSKKKKDKTDEPTKTKTKRSSRKASEDAIAIDGAPAAAMGWPAPSKPRSAGGGKKKAAAALGFSNQDVALRAYYIAERRRKLDVPGDEMGDWVEAERQLRKEAHKKSA